VIAFRKEETGVLVMELSEHIWPENLELAIPVVHDVARFKGSGEFRRDAPKGAISWLDGKSRSA
jgi:hypothetical protein